MRKINRKFMFLAAVSVLSVLGLQANGSGEGAESTAGSDKMTELSMLIDNQSNLDGIKGIIAAAEQDLNMTVTIELRPGGAEGDNLLKTRLVAEEMTDLNFYNSGSLFMALNPQNHFVDLTDEPFMDKVLDSFKQTVSVGGRTYAVPSGSIMTGGWLYNKAVYNELGLEVPETWSELMDNCAKIKAADKIPVIAPYKDSWTAQLLVLGDYYNVYHEYPGFADDYTAHKVGFADTPIALRGFEKLQEIYMKGFIGEEPLATTYEVAQKLLIAGDGVHFPMLTFVLGSLYNLDPENMDNIGFFPQPGDAPDSNGATLWMPGGVSIYKNNKKTDEAVRFAEYYISDAAFAAYMTAQKPDGPFAVKNIELPDDVYGAIKDMLPFINSGKTAPALEFLSPIKGPNLPQICVQTGIGLTSPLESAREYDKDVEKQAKQLGLAGW